MISRCCLFAVYFRYCFLGFLVSLSFEIWCEFSYTFELNSHSLDVVVLLLLVYSLKKTQEIINSI